MLQIFRTWTGGTQVSTAGSSSVMLERQELAKPAYLQHTGTTDAHLRESDSRPALKAGDTVSLMTILFGVNSATVYQLLEVDAPNKVVFFGISRFHESTDTVTFRQKQNAKDIVVVEYSTDIKLVRWYKWFQPFSGFVMANLAKEAVEGMQKKLQELQEDGKFMPERSAAAV